MNAFCRECLDAQVCRPVETRDVYEDDVNQIYLALFRCLDDRWYLVSFDRSGMERIRLDSLDDLERVVVDRYRDSHEDEALRMARMARRALGRNP